MKEPPTENGQRTGTEVSQENSKRKIKSKTQPQVREMQIPARWLSAQTESKIGERVQGVLRKEELSVQACRRGLGGLGSTHVGCPAKSPGRETSGKGDGVLPVKFKRGQCCDTVGRAVAYEAGIPCQSTG